MKGIPGLAIEASIFRSVLGHHPTGVSVITSRDADGDPLGLVVGTFNSVSLEPPLVGFFPAATSASWARIEATGHFCVNILAADQEPLCRMLGRPAPERFDEVSHRSSPQGLPILDGVVAWIDCRLHAVHDAGDHRFVLGEVTALAAERDSAPLVFWRGAFDQR